MRQEARRDSAPIGFSFPAQTLCSVCVCSPSRSSAIGSGITSSQTATGHSKTVLVTVLVAHWTLSSSSSGLFMFSMSKVTQLHMWTNLQIFRVSVPRWTICEMWVNSWSENAWKGRALNMSRTWSRHRRSDKVVRAYTLGERKKEPVRRAFLCGWAAFRKPFRHEGCLFTFNRWDIVKGGQGGDGRV